MSDDGLVDIAVPMGRVLCEHDERHPEEVAERRREAALRLLANGFTRAEVTKLYGNVLEAAPRRTPTVAETYEDVPMAAFRVK